MSSLFATQSAVTAMLGNGPDVIGVRAIGRDHDGRMAYGYGIFRDGSLLAAGEDIRSGVGGIGHAVHGFTALIDFLSADAEKYARLMGPVPAGDDGYLFGETVAEWAYGNSDELTMLALDLEG